MIPKTLDRRARKTRASLTHCLLQLMQEKDIKDISVRELSDLADINRGTFYLHYSDIYDMINQLEDDFFAEFEAVIRADLQQDGITDTPYDVLYDVLSVIHKNRALAKALIGPHGDLSFVNRMKHMVEERLKEVLSAPQGTEHLEYHLAFIISGYVGVIETWLRTDSPLSPREMAALCTSMSGR